MKDNDAPLSRHLSPRLDEARLARQFAAAYAKAPKLRQRRAFGSFAFSAVAAAAVILLAVFWITRDRSAPLASLEGTRLASDLGGNTLTMPDGSRAVLDPGTRLLVAAARRDMTRLVLEEGGVDLEVTHVAGRRFVVAAGDHEVSVHGTHFSVRFAIRDGAHVLDVAVSSGEVHVARGSDPESVLRTGESWSATLDAPAVPVDAEPATQPVADAGVDAAPAVSMPSAKELLARAEAARAANHPEEAARALDTLRKRHRRDPRAGLAAFELGRLRFDVLKDPAGAADAFADVAVLAPDAPFREDAEARRVEALEAFDPTRCATAKEAYLARYPQGLHRRAVAARCGSR
jgi:transmembrane sensor